MSPAVSRPVTIRVMSVEDRPLLPQGIASVIASQPDMSFAAQAASGLEAIRLYRETRPDVMLMDLRLPDMSGIDALLAIRSEFPEARVVMLATFEGDVEVRRALAAGARGYVFKNALADELLKAIRDIHSGKTRIPPDVAAYLGERMGNDNLTNRETEVLRELCRGKRNRGIAEHLFISEETVKVHVKHIMDKLGANDRTQAIAIAVRRGIVHL